MPSRTGRVRPAELFTAEEIAVIKRAAHAVWDGIAYDILQAVADEKGKSIHAVSIPARDVRELVLDADRLFTRLRSDRSLSAATKAKLNWDNVEVIDDILRDAFGRGRYGM